MRAGSLRHVVTVQAVTETRSATGDPTPTWATVSGGLHCWAEIAAVGGQERMAADTLASEATHTVTMRYRPDLTLTTKHRLLWGSRVLNVRRVDDSRIYRGERTLLCTEEVQ